MSQNRAAFFDKVGEPFRVDNTPMYQPGPDEVLIKNHAWGIAPVDWKVQDTGAIIQNWPIVLGCDVAGEIEAVGDNITTFKKGDRVTGHSTSLANQYPSHGGFNLYSVLPAAIVARIPTTLAYKDAVVLPLAIDTAAVGLYSKDAGHLGLPYPSINPSDTGKTILVWGGASSVGIATIQLAVASGVRVVTTSSPKNFDLVKRAGASVAFDYTSASVVEDVVAALEAQGEFAGIYDAIALPGQSHEKIFSVAKHFGGGNIAFTLPVPENLPQGVTGGWVLALNEVTHPVWKDYVAQALGQGKLLCLPPADIVGKGIESIQKGVDITKKGVSGKKIVVEA